MSGAESCGADGVPERSGRDEILCKLRSFMFPSHLQQARDGYSIERRLSFSSSMDNSMIRI